MSLHTNGNGITEVSNAPFDVELPYDFAREELQTMKFLKRHHKRLDKPGEFPEKAEFMKEQHGP